LKKIKQIKERIESNHKQIEEWSSYPVNDHGAMQSYLIGINDALKWVLIDEENTD